MTPIYVNGLYAVGYLTIMCGLGALCDKLRRRNEAS